jgi:hypothetical protein
MGREIESRQDMGDGSFYLRTKNIQVDEITFYDVRMRFGPQFFFIFLRGSVIPFPVGFCYRQVAILLKLLGSTVIDIIICPKFFRPKWRFVKSSPGEAALTGNPVLAGRRLARASVGRHLGEEHGRRQHAVGLLALEVLLQGVEVNLREASFEIQTMKKMFLQPMPLFLIINYINNAY